MEDELLKTKDLIVEFIIKDGRVRAVDNINLTIYKGEILCILGETGCGKSVFGSAILKLLPDNAVVKGTITYKDQEIARMNEKEFRKLRGKEISTVPQSPATSLDPTQRCGRQVEEMLELHTSLKKQDRKKYALELMKKLGLPRLPQLADNYPYELSGGMKQRVLISMGISCKPNFIVVDEPTKGLDWVRKKEVVKMLESLARENSSAMMVITHDFTVADELADYIAIMYAGEIVEFGTKDDILHHACHPYTRGLINALPRNGFHGVRGFSPPLNQIPMGCRFHPRCPMAEKKCSQEHIKMGEMSVEHVVRCRYV